MDPLDRTKLLLIIWLVRNSTFYILGTRVVILVCSRRDTRARLDDLFGMDASVQTTTVSATSLHVESRLLLECALRANPDGCRGKEHLGSTTFCAV